jgi:GTP diphosphokinase / guanosine-3',5'-bis(diphosphate) 3'-diphosphatase
MLTLSDIFRAFKHPLTADRKKLITDAFQFAESAHAGQKRQSGEEYLQHSLATAVTLAEIGMGSKTISGGLLHDVPEDTSVTLTGIEEKFGSEIATIVDGVTKVSRIKLRGSRDEYFLENMRKMFMAMAADIRVIIIKLADRLHNMKTLDHLPPDKQERIARETMDVFVPLANRLGIGQIKGQLEDLCFKYLEPENYNLVKDMEEKQYHDTEKYVNRVIEDLKQELKKEGIRLIDIEGRAKHLYRLFRKLKRNDMDINRIYDLAAVRVIVPEIADCYEALGIVHKSFRPMVGRIKDYISLPKPNGYQSIHTTIFGPEGRILEVQIRTQKMHDEAEFGIAAHWIYSEKEKRTWKQIILRQKGETPKKELTWVNQLREWQSEIGSDDVEEFMEGLKIDFFKNHIFAFTPRGDIIDLPEEATPIDFAYSIHSEVGNRANGAKVDGKMVPLDYHIKNGQMVEIITVKDKKKPSRDWLNFVKTSMAKSRIRKELKEKK